MRLLLVDDDRRFRALLRTTFEDVDVEVEEAGHAGDALSRIDASKPEVIVLDVGLPGVDGLTFCRRLKDDPETRDIRIVLLTGREDVESQAEAAGADSDTFAGMAGMGDLIVTCWHPSGRNRRAGELIARGATPEEAEAEIGQVVEGLTTAPVLQQVARRLGAELPITDGVCAVLGGVTLTELVSSLMGRAPTEE